MAAVGVAWGLYDSLKAGPQPVGGAIPPPSSVVPPAPLVLPPEVARVVRLAVSAARADGALVEAERAAILRHASDAGIAAHVDAELAHPRPLAEIVAGITADADRRDLYVLAFTIVRADETVSGAERIYLAQLAHALGLDPATAAGARAADRRRHRRRRHTCTADAVDCHAVRPAADARRGVCPPRFSARREHQDKEQRCKVHSSGTWRSADIRSAR